MVKLKVWEQNFNTFLSNFQKVSWTETIPKGFDLQAIETDHFKIVVVGDGAVGKTCLVFSYAHHTKFDDYVPTRMEVTYGTPPAELGTGVSISLWDTAGREDSTIERRLSYPNAKVILICFSITNRYSFEQITNQYVKEIEAIATGTPFILVGCKSDLRQDKEVLDRLATKNAPYNTPVSVTEAQQLAASLNTKYVECSAFTRENVDDVFKEAIKLAHADMVTKYNSRQKCSIM